MSAERATKFDAQLSRITAAAIADCQAAIAKALTEHFGQPLASEVGWLIEWPPTPGFQPRWWHPVTGWTTDAARAIRYARAVDAEAAIERGCFVNGVAATEHSWLSPAGDRS